MHSTIEYAIQTTGLTKRFGAITAVENVSVSIQPGEIFGLLGPNGAGKTTIIRMLSALISVTSGSATVNGFEIGKDDQQIRQVVGILTETPGMYDQISAERNLSFFAEMYGIDDIPSRVERYLNMLGLWERRHEPVGTFSKGMRQKLAIARSMLHRPSILLLDEPTSGLDPSAARMVREFIANLKREGRTIVLCTHNLNEADKLCDRIAILNTSVLALDTPTALRRKLYGRSVVFHLVENKPMFLPAIEAIDFVEKVQSIDNKLIISLEEPEKMNPILVNKLVALGAEIQFVGELRRTLEDVYLQLIKQENAQ